MDFQLFLWVPGKGLSLSLESDQCWCCTSDRGAVVCRDALQVPTRDAAVTISTPACHVPERARRHTSAEHCLPTRRRRTTHGVPRGSFNTTTWRGLLQQDRAEPVGLEATSPTFKSTGSLLVSPRCWPHSRLPRPDYSGRTRRPARLHRQLHQWRACCRRLSRLLSPYQFPSTSSRGTTSHNNV